MFTSIFSNAIKLHNVQIQALVRMYVYVYLIQSLQQVEFWENRNVSRIGIWNSKFVVLLCKWGLRCLYEPSQQFVAYLFPLYRPVSNISTCTKTIYLTCMTNCTFIPLTYTAYLTLTICLTICSAKRHRHKQHIYVWHRLL